MFDSSHSIAEFLTATAAKQPTPGGGSVTALVGALGAAVGEMVVQYSVGKKSLANFAEELQGAVGELGRARGIMLQLMVEDQLAYEVMSQLMKLPRDSAQRKERWDPTLLACIRAPQGMAATAVALLQLCDRLVNIVNYHLLSDLAVCALYNVRINSRQLEDEAEKTHIEQSSFDLLSNAAGLIQHISPRIWDRESRGE